jgi:HD-like signal output (HDOD) protein
VEQHSDRFAPLITANEYLSQAEKEILGFDHGEIGGILLTNWKLPKNLVESVTLHHFPENATVNPRETLVISLANNLSNRLGFALEQPVERLNQEQREKAYKMLNLPPDWEEQHHEDITTLAAQIVELIENL